MQILSTESDRQAVANGVISDISRLHVSVREHILLYQDMLLKFFCILPVNWQKSSDYLYYYRFPFLDGYEFLGKAKPLKYTISTKKFGGLTRMNLCLHLLSWGNLTEILCSVWYRRYKWCNHNFCQWRFNVVQLFLGDVRISHLRKMIVDLEVKLTFLLIFMISSFLTLKCAVWW